MPMVQMRKISREYPNSGIHMVRLEDSVEPASLGWYIAGIISGPMQPEFLRNSCDGGWARRSGM